MLTTLTGVEMFSIEMFVCSIAKLAVVWIEEGRGIQRRATGQLRPVRQSVELEGSDK